VSDHQSNPFGIQWIRYWDDAPVPDLVKTVAHVAFEVDDLEQMGEIVPVSCLDVGRSTTRRDSVTD